MGINGGTSLMLSKPICVGLEEIKQEQKYVVIDGYPRMYEVCIGPYNSGFVITDKDGKQIPEIYYIIIDALRICMKGCVPIYVFDGIAPTAKKVTTRRRQETKKKAEKQIKKAEMAKQIVLQPSTELSKIAKLAKLTQDDGSGELSDIEQSEARSYTSDDCPQTTNFVEFDTEKSEAKGCVSDSEKLEDHISAPEEMQIICGDDREKVISWKKPKSFSQVGMEKDGDEIEIEKKETEESDDKFKIEEEIASEKKDFKQTIFKNKIPSILENFREQKDDKIKYEQHIKFLKRAYKINKTNLETAKTILRYMGFPVFDAPNEADPQCAVIAKDHADKVYGVLTPDTDILVYGSPRILKKIGRDYIKMHSLVNTIEHLSHEMQRVINNSKNPALIKKYELKNKISNGKCKIKLTHSNLIDIGCLMGNNYCSRVKIKKEKGIIFFDVLLELYALNDMNLIKTLEMLKKTQKMVTNEYIETVKIARDIYCYKNISVYRPSAHDIELKAPDAVMLHDMCKTFLEEEDIKKIIEFLNKMYEFHKKNKIVDTSKKRFRYSTIHRSKPETFSTNTSRFSFGKSEGLILGLSMNIPDAKYKIPICPEYSQFLSPKIK